MKTLTVRLPEPLVADIEAESRGRKISKSDVVRERLERAPLIIARSESDVIVILLDSVTASALSRRSGIRVRDLNPNAQVLLIGMDADECAFLRAVRAGVRGYLLNEASATDVIAAIHSVARAKLSAHLNSAKRYSIPLQG